MNPTDIKYYAPLPHDMPDDYDPSDAIAEHADKMVCVACGFAFGMLAVVVPLFIGGVL